MGSAQWICALAAVLALGCSSGGGGDGDDGDTRNSRSRAAGDADRQAGDSDDEPRGVASDDDGDDGDVIDDIDNADDRGDLHAAIPPGPSPFPPGTRSLRLKRSIAVRVTPAEDASRYGTIARDTRVIWKRVTEGDGCDQRWVEIQPRGWICERYLEPSERGPIGVELPKLDHGELVPGVYGKVIGEDVKLFALEGDELVEGRAVDGSMMVRRYGERSADEIAYWLIDKRKKEYLAVDNIREYRPSQWGGTRLGDDTGLSLPIGFPLARKNVSHRVEVHSAPRGGRVVGRIRGRTPIQVLETATDDDGAPIAYRVGEGQWARANRMRVARLTAPPAIVFPGERWLDIDLDAQVLVAYEGERPVYVTMVSTGSKKHPTETGVYRVWVKFAQTDMSDLAGESPYSVATVPWTQFYAKDLALHSAYWHDTFGTARSHGCTNLSPIDARFLYFWSDPPVPPGWSMANGSIDQPGSLIRLRSAEDPEPPLVGYAQRIQDARAARASNPN